MDDRLKNHEILKYTVKSYNLAFDKQYPNEKYKFCDYCGRKTTYLCICLDAQIDWIHLIEEVKYVGTFKKSFPIDWFKPEQRVYQKEFGKGSLLHYDYDDIDKCWVCFDNIENPIKKVSAQSLSKYNQ